MKRVISFFLTFILLAGIAVVPGLAITVEDIKAGTFVTFGSYPQTSVVDSGTVAELNAQSLSWKYFEYYTNGKRENFMQYADTTLDGTRYRAVTFAHYREIHSTNYTDTYQKKNGYEPNKVYWFKYDPIVWRVLDADAGLIIAENLIDSQPFHNEYYNGCGDAEYKHYVSNWAYSSLRSWLNDDFYNTAFEDEKSCIRTTSLVTPSSYSSAYDADPTKDNVFILSGDDVLRGPYDFSSSNGSGEYTNRIAYGTDYARCQGLWVYESVNSVYDGASYWHLRTPYMYDRTYTVRYDGIVDGSGPFPYNTSLGVRPALKVDLGSAISQSLIKKTYNSGLVIYGPYGTKIYYDYIPGDVDGDGEVLANDARLALRASAKLVKLYGVAFRAADVDEDGDVLADDARQILRYSAKLQHEFVKK